MGPVIIVKYHMTKAMAVTARQDRSLTEFFDTLPGRLDIGAKGERH